MTEEVVNMPQLFRLQEGACLAWLSQEYQRYPCPSLPEPRGQPQPARAAVPQRACGQGRRCIPSTACGQQRPNSSL